MICREGDGTPSSTFAWKIPWTGEPGRLPILHLLSGPGSSPSKGVAEECTVFLADLAGSQRTRVRTTVVLLISLGRAFNLESPISLHNIKLVRN